jgi:hypothetical protein
LTFFLIAFHYFITALAEIQMGSMIANSLLIKPAPGAFPAGSGGYLYQ